MSTPAAHSSGWKASAGEHHVAAVRAAPQRGAGRVDADPTAGTRVRRRGRATESRRRLAVVGRVPALAVAGRAAHVRHEHRVPGCREDLDVPVLKLRPRLGLRAAVRTAAPADPASVGSDTAVPRSRRSAGSSCRRRRPP